MIHLLATLILVSAVLVAPGQSPPDDLPSAKVILDRYVEATGGKVAYGKILNRVTEASLTMPGQGLELGLTIHAARPNRVYTVIEGEAVGTIEKGSDGEVVWERSLMTGPVVKEGREREDALRESTFDKLVHWRKIYAKAVCAGVEAVNGTPCFKVRVTPRSDPSGTGERARSQSLYFERTSGLLVRMKFTLESAMGPLPTEVILGDYKRVDGILLPHTMKTKVLGQERVVTVKRVRHNLELPADRFALPADVQALVAAKRPDEKG